MPIFFDTNVPVGYIFKWDPWHPYAESAFAIEDLKYWSETVKNETRRKIKEFKNSYSNLLLFLWSELKNTEGKFSKKDIIQLANSSEIDLDTRKIRITIEEIWKNEKFKPMENSKKIADTFDRIALDLNRDVDFRKKEFRSNMQFHTRTGKYPTIQKILEKKIHYPDVDIFLDAHDLCFKHKNLEVITSDYNPENIKHVKSYTLIRTITNLKDCNS